MKQICIRKAKIERFAESLLCFLENSEILSVTIYHLSHNSIIETTENIISKEIIKRLELISPDKSTVHFGIFIIDSLFIPGIIISVKDSLLVASSIEIYLQPIRMKGESSL